MISRLDVDQLHVHPEAIAASLHRSALIGNFGTASLEAVKRKHGRGSNSYQPGAEDEREQPNRDQDDGRLHALQKLLHARSPEKLLLNLDAMLGTDKRQCDNRGGSERRVVRS